MVTRAELRDRAQRDDKLVRAIVDALGEQLDGACCDNECERVAIAHVALSAVKRCLAECAAERFGSEP